MPRPKKLNVSKEELERLYWKEGLTLKEIAKMFGVAKSTVREHFLRYGIEARKGIIKRCIDCGREFIVRPNNTSAKRCLNCRRLLYRKKQVRRRKKLKSLWGSLGSSRKLRRKAVEKSEKVAVEALKRNGWNVVVRFTKFYPQFPFDILAEKDGKRYLVQVTLCYLNAKNKKHRELARALGMNYAVVFVSPKDFKTYIIKEKNTGAISLEDIKNAMTLEKPPQ